MSSLTLGNAKVTTKNRKISLEITCNYFRELLSTMDEVPVNLGRQTKVKSEILI